MMLERPKIVFSFDFELGWGVLDSPLWQQREASSLYVNLRPVFDELVKVLKDTQLPTTWAMVSSLLVESEADLNADHLPDSYKDSVFSFYRHSKESSRCGLDLIDKLGGIDMEVASHTSTHIYANQTDVTSDQYVQDVRQSIELLERYFNCSLSSLVFPRDQANFNIEVAKLHPLAFRLNPNYGVDCGKIRRVMSGASRVYKMPPRSKVIKGTYGESYQTGSLYFNWSGGSFENIKKRLTKIQANRMLNNMSAESIYHVWLHPFNLAESKEHLDVFLKFIKDIAELRNKGLVEVVTMSDVSKDCTLGFEKYD